MAYNEQSRIPDARFISGKALEEEVARGFPTRQQSYGLPADKRHREQLIMLCQQQGLTYELYDDGMLSVTVQNGDPGYRMPEIELRFDPEGRIIGEIRSEAWRGRVQTIIYMLDEQGLLVDALGAITTNNGTRLEFSHFSGSELSSWQDASVPGPDMRYTHGIPYLTKPDSPTDLPPQ